MIRTKVLFTGLFLGAAVAVAVFVWHFNIKAGQVAPESFLKTTIPAGATFSDLSRWLGITTDTANAIFESAKGKYDLATIVKGRDLALTFDALGGGLNALVYEIDADKELIITEESGSWQAEVTIIDYEIREKEAAGVIDESLYKAMKAENLDDRLILALAETLAWQIDFAADIRTGDSYKIIYEDRYRDGQYVMPGRLLAVKFINDGETFRGFYFSGSDQTRAGFYDENGNALLKVFLKSPLQYKYISSGYSLGRVNPITKKVAPHRGIDYAAPAGTPAVAVGDGTVIQAGWNGPYGISALIRHNETYQTRYGHFASLAKGIKVGAKIKQGQVVGYVGSTGESTGPHLHYEMHKFGNYVNPFKVEVPPGEPVKDSDRAAFQELVSRYNQRL